MKNVLQHHTYTQTVTDTQTHRHTDTQTHRHADTQTHIEIGRAGWEQARMKETQIHTKCGSGTPIQSMALVIKKSFG